VIGIIAMARGIAAAVLRDALERRRRAERDADA
jgi:hypothetical protein